jgi:CRP/FNR family transcriptional regulator, cyclic AMP receptor protein
LSEFKFLVYSGSRTDVVVFTETSGRAPQTAISLAREKHAVLVLFQGWTPHYDASEFHLVIPMTTPVKHWIAGLTDLIEQSPHSIQSPAALKLASKKSREEASATWQKIEVEYSRSAIEQRRNRDFKVDFPRSAAEPADLGRFPSPGGFLRSLSAEARLEFQTMVRFSKCLAGTLLFAEQQLPQNVFFVLTGQIKLSANSKNGRRLIVHIANPGEILGLASAFAGCPHETTAEACYSCDFATVDSTDFLRFLERHPSAFRAAACELGRTYSRACARLRTMGVSYSVTEKLAGLFLEWCALGIENKRGTQIRMGLTHEEIGQCIGTTRESVTRTLHDLQQRRIINQTGSVLTILDRSALESCAGCSDSDVVPAFSSTKM